jgi:hypothetical protein
MPRRFAKTRPTTSGPLPGEEGTIRRIGRSGYAAQELAANSRNETPAMSFEIILLLL